MRTLLCSLLLLACSVLQAATITVGPSNCSSAAVNNGIAAAANGDTVLITCTGTVTWIGTVNIPNTKGISLIVQGGTNTPKGSAAFPLTVVGGSGTTVIDAEIGPNHAVTRISGFKFQNAQNNIASPFIKIGGQGVGTVAAGRIGGFRVDNNYFDTISAYVMLAVFSDQGNLFGLIDNNTFHNTWRSDDPAYGPYNLQVWNYWHPSGSNQCWGCDGWTNNDFNYGDAKNVFIEDNLFEQTPTAPGHMRHYIESELGARYVSRYNTFNNFFGDANPDIHDAHGLCAVDSNGAGARGGEVYHNTVNGAGYYRFINMRGGSWLIYDNVITPGTGNPIELQEHRAETSCGLVVCSTTNNMAPVMPPWPVPAHATWSANAPWVPQVTDASRYQLPQQIFWTWTWNNTNASTHALINPVVPGDCLEQLYIQPGRDYFPSTTQPPSSSLAYTPYTYPHPLVSGLTPPTAPNNLRIVP